MRALSGRRVRQWRPVRSGLQAGARKGAKTLRCVQGLSQLRRNRRSLPATTAAHRQQRRQDEDLEANQRRDWVARQADEGFAQHPAHRQRLARPHRDLPEVQLSQFLDHRADEVPVTHADAADRQHEVGLGRLSKRAPDVVDIVAGTQDPHGESADRRHGCRQRRRDGVIELVRAGLVTRIDDLVSGRHQRHHRPPDALYRLGTEGGQQRQLRRAHVGAPFERELAAAQVAARGAQVAPDRGRAANKHALAVHRRLLDLDDGIRSAGNRRAGHDPDRGPGRDLTGEGTTGRRGTGDPQSHRRSRLGLRDVAGADREAVHRGVVKARKVAAGDDWCRQHPFARVRDRDSFRFEHCQHRVDSLACLVNTQQGSGCMPVRHR